MRCFAKRFGVCLSAILFAGAGSLFAEEQASSKTTNGVSDKKLVATTAPKKASKVDQQAGTEVEFFQAIRDKQLEVDFIAKDATQATVIFRNQGKQPISIKLPETFAAVPVLGQGFGGDMGGGMGGGGMGGGGGGGAQGMGGGMGGGGMDMGGGMMGGGMFRVDADKPRKMTVATVCLEHGKLDPTPRMKYAIVPLPALNGDPKVAEVCRMLGEGKVAQNTAQAAAWHFANGLSWQELAAKPRLISKYTGVQMFFSPNELQSAHRLVTKIQVDVAESETEDSSPGLSYSENSTATESAK